MASSKGRKARKRRGTRARSRRGLARRLRRAPAARLLLYGLVGAIALLSINLIYQVARKPSELFYPLRSALQKSPEQTWQVYGPAFRRNATELISATLLAALAQTEGAGNPVAHTYWRWAWSARPFELYRPASSAVGMYQITDATYEEARHYCIHDHQRVPEGRWHDWHACWLNGLYLRVLPEDAIELTAAYLDLKVSSILRQLPPRSTAGTLQVQHLAAVIHLCGAGAATAYAQQGFRFKAHERCGEHDPRLYLKRIEQLQGQFARLAREDGAPP